MRSRSSISCALDDDSSTSISALSISGGIAEPVDEVLGDRPQPAAQRGHLAADRLGARAREAAVLHEPAAVGLDRGQREQVAEHAQRDLVVAVDHGRELVDEALQHEPLDVRAAGGDHVVLHAAEHVDRVHALVHAPLQPPGDPGEDVLLAPAEHRELVLRVEQPGLLVPAVVLAAGQHVLDPLQQLVRAGALEHGVDGQAGDEPHHAELVEVAEAGGVVGEQALGDQLQQDVVVALEGGEHVGVGAQRAEPVGHQVAGAAAGLAALLDGPAAVPGAERLGAGGQRLEGAPLTVRRVGGREHVVQLGEQLLLGEVQRVGLGEQRQQPALVHAVVEEQLLLVGVRRAELPALVGVLDRHGERHLARRDAGATDAHPALDQGAEHREEPPVLVLDVGDVAAVLGRRRRSG